MVPAKVEYAALAALELAARAHTEEPVPLRDLADSQKIPAQFLVQLLQRLKVAGLVRSTRGASGGYLLAQPAAELTLWDVWAAVMVDEVDVTCEPDPRRHGLRKIWKEILDTRRAQLEGISIEALLQRCQDSQDPMYYI